MAAASVSVVQYSTSPHKMNVLQQNTTINEPPRREIIILRKQPSIQPKEEVISRKKQTQLYNHQKKEATKTAQQPVAVARRNARERNRVKQVNNGFANLRQHIPSFIAAAFESNSRGGTNKKLSKVETLRMAVEYIRSLEDLLSLGEDSSNNANNSTSGCSSISSFSPMSSSHLAAYQMMSPSADEDDLSNTNPTPPPQFHYQIIHQDHLSYGDDSENLEPLDGVEDHILSDPSLMDADLEFRGAQDLSILHSDSLSPGMYSEASDVSDGNFKSEDLISLKSNELAVEPNNKSNVLNVMQWWDQQQQQQQSPNS